MKITKTDYILRSLKKISHKKWELFIISRILQKLDDDEVEFVTQQLVRMPDGRRFLTDIYFPQLDIHLEIDEGHHFNNVVADHLREKDIVQVTEHKIKRIKIFDQSGSEKSLDQIRSEADKFVDLVRSLKKEKEDAGSFVHWDWDTRYSSAPIIARGYLDVSDNVTFQHQVEALRCFGFKGKGLQRGVWKIPDQSGDWVWFPRLYRHYIWNNELSSDGHHIYERALDDEGRKSIAKQIENAKESPPGNVIVFAKARDSLGNNLLRYVGTFHQNLEKSGTDLIQFDLMRTRENVRLDY